MGGRDDKGGWEDTDICERIHDMGGDMMIIWMQCWIFSLLKRRKTSDRQRREGVAFRMIHSFTAKVNKEAFEEEEKARKKHQILVIDAP